MNTDQHRSHLGRVLPVVVAVTAGVAGTTFALKTSSSLMNAKPSNRVVTSPLVAPLTAGELRSVLCRAGLDPQALAVAGVTPEQTTALVVAAKAYLRDAIQGLREADSSFIAARQEVDSLPVTRQHG